MIALKTLATHVIATCSAICSHRSKPFHHTDCILTINLKTCECNLATHLLIFLSNYRSSSSYLRRSSDCWHQGREEWEDSDLRNCWTEQPCALTAPPPEAETEEIINQLLNTQDEATQRISIKSFEACKYFPSPANPWQMTLRGLTLMSGNAGRNVNTS